MVEFLLQAFVTLFVVVDPVGLAPVFMGLAHSGTAAYRRRMALRAVALATAVLLLFALLGPAVLRWLGVGLPAFRIAGGLLLMLLAIEMVFARQTSGLRSTTEQELAEADRREDISVFPLAIPLIAGPGAMTSLLLLMGRSEGDPARVWGVLGVLLAVLALTQTSLLLAARLTGWLGITGANVFTRVLGIVLSALAVQFVLDGLRPGLGL